MNEKPSSVDWAALEAKPEFRALLARKARFIVGATVFFMSYYLALPILVGYFPDLMKKPRSFLKAVAKANAAQVTLIDRHGKEYLASLDAQSPAPAAGANAAVAAPAAAIEVSAPPPAPVPVG